jgi:hypothetical protein
MDFSVGRAKTLNLFVESGVGSVLKEEISLIKCA